MSLICPQSAFILGSDRRCIVLTSKEFNSLIICANLSLLLFIAAAGEGLAIVSCFRGLARFSSLYSSGDLSGDVLAGVLITRSRILKELSLCKLAAFLSCFCFPFLSMTLIITLTA